MIYKTSLLVQEIVRRAMLTAGQAGIGTDFILSIATTEMITNLVPDIINSQENWLIHFEIMDVPAGTPWVRFPTRAFGESLRQLYWIGRDGTKHELDLLYEEDLDGFSDEPADDPSGFVLSGQKIRLFPVPAEDGRLYVSYPFRPNNLCQETAALQIAGVTDDGWLQFDAAATLPVEWAGSAPVDIIDHQSGNGIIAYNVVPTQYNAPTDPPAIRVADTSGMHVGNWVAPAGMAPVPMIPEDCHLALIELCVMRIARARGQEAIYNMAKDSYTALRNRLPVILNHRLIAKPESVGGGSIFLPDRPFAL